jgi:hypothetical protein
MTTSRADWQAVADIMRRMERRLGSSAWVEWRANMRDVAAALAIAERHIKEGGDPRSQREPSARQQAADNTTPASPSDPVTERATDRADDPSHHKDWRSGEATGRLPTADEIEAMTVRLSHASDTFRKVLREQIDMAACAVIFDEAAALLRRFLENTNAIRKGMGLHPLGEPAPDASADPPPKSRPVSHIPSLGPTARG